MLALVLLLMSTQVWCEVVVTLKGPIQGQTSQDGSYATYLGVPYALVDEDNPFQASLDYPDFKTAFNASDPSIKCPQATTTYEGILQCLRLNIYVPQSTNTKKSVLVWFHGGGFFFGSSGDYGGKHLVQHDIIVVTANFRLGPYGFLCLNDENVPGNQGLKDQVTALRWIKANIAAFGGNPDAVTIAGESFGGGSVDLHLYSNFEKLFDKAIIQSGGAGVQFMFVKGDHEAAVKIARKLGSNTNITKEALSYLAKKSPREVIGAFNNLSLVLRVCQEKRFKRTQQFLTTDLFHLKSAKVRDTPLLLGYNSKETFADYATRSDEYYTTIQRLVYDNLASNLRLKPDELDNLARVVQTFYFGSESISKDTIMELVDLTSDFILNNAAEASVDRYLSQGGPKVYKYIFSFIKGSPFENMPGAGASHTDELQYLFEFINRTNTSPEQLRMQDGMTTMWSNFVKYGDPTPSTSDLLPVRWVPATSYNGSRPYLNIDTVPTVSDRVYNKRMAFWQLFWTSYWKKSVLL